MPPHSGWEVATKNGVYRYELGRELGVKEPLLAAIEGRVVKPILWIMLNPSTATADQDDATIRTIAGFSEFWGHNRLLVGNLYAYRTSDPRALFAAAKSGVDIVGPQNDAQLLEMVHKAQRNVMVAWGQNADPARAAEVVKLLAGVTLRCLRVNQDGSPVHPLYQPRTIVPQVWDGHGDV